VSILNFSEARTSTNVIWARCPIKRVKRYRYVNSNITQTHTFQNRKKSPRNKTAKNESNTSWNL